MGDLPLLAFTLPPYPHDEPYLEYDRYGNLVGLVVNPLFHWTVAPDLVIQPPFYMECIGNSVTVWRGTEEPVNWLDEL